MTEQERQEAQLVREKSCVFLVRKPDEWLTEFGSDEGRAKWLERSISGYKNLKSAQAGYRRIRKKAIEHHATLGFHCLHGLPYGVSRLVLGSFFNPTYSDAFCDRQEGCKKYLGTVQALIDLETFPRGKA